MPAAQGMTEEEFPPSSGPVRVVPETAYLQKSPGDCEDTLPFDVKWNNDSFREAAYHLGR